MRKITSLLIAALLAVFVFSCQLPKSSVPGEAATLSLEQQIDQEYPYWKVYISSFEAQPGATLKAEEKKTLIEYLATIRFLVNTPEFKNLVINDYGIDGTKAWRTDSWPGGEHNVTSKTQDLGRNRILETIQQAAYKARYIKKPGSYRDPYEADLGDFYYVFLGYKPIWYGPGLATKTPPRVLLPNDNYLPNYPYKATLARSIFHEHLHHLGYQHDLTQEAHGGGVPYEISAKIRFLYQWLVIDNKYPQYVDAWNKLKEEYLELHKDLLQEDTVGGATRALTVSDNDDRLVGCSHEGEH